MSRNRQIILRESDPKALSDGDLYVWNGNVYRFHEGIQLSGGYSPLEIIQNDWRDEHRADELCVRCQTKRRFAGDLCKTCDKLPCSPNPMISELVSALKDSVRHMCECRGSGVIRAMSGVGMDDAPIFYESSCSSVACKNARMLLEKVQKTSPD